MEGHIYIYGIISSFQDDQASKYGEVNIKDINNQLTNNKEADTLIVHINSNGGDVYEGFAIHDVLRASGKKIITQAEGIVASIATVVFMAGDERRMTENAELMIHNPWGMTMGDSSDVQKYAQQLKAVEDKLINFYVGITGLSVDDITAMMKDETFMTADQAIEKHFATEKVTQIKAVAQLKIDNMTNEELNAKMEENSKGIFSKIVASLRKWGVIKNMTVKTADDKTLDFGENVNDDSEIVVGVEAKVDGAPAEGEYKLPDGKTYVFASGKLTEIKEAPAPPPANAEMEALKTENENLKAQLTDINTKYNESVTLLQGVQKDLKDFKAQMTSDIKGLTPTPPEPPVVRKPFK